MPSSMAPASQFSGYSVGETSANKSNMETNKTNPPAVSSNVASLLQNLNVNDLFEKLVSSGIVKPATGPSASLQVMLPSIETTTNKETTSSSSVTKPIDKSLSKNVVNLIKPVNLMKSETLRM